MLSFRRRPSENIDDALSRFETLRQQTRTQARGFELPIPVTCWLLLEAMHIPRQTWPFVLGPWQHRMPEDEPGLRTLCESIRHQGHIAETPHAGNYSWRGHQNFLSDNGTPIPGSYPSSVDGWDGGDEWDPVHEEETPVFYDCEGWASCTHCGAYVDELEDNDSDSDSEDDYDEQELASYLGTFEGATEDSLLADYFLARARYRHFTGKRSRRTRFPRFRMQRGGKGGKKGRGKGRKQGRKGRPAWSFKGASLTPRSLAGGMGVGPCPQSQCLGGLRGG